MIPVKPGVHLVIGGAGLAGDVVTLQRFGAPGGAALNDVSEHGVHQEPKVRIQHLGCPAHVKGFGHQANLWDGFELSGADRIDRGFRAQIGTGLGRSGLQNDAAQGVFNAIN